MMHSSTVETPSRTRPSPPPESGGLKLGRLIRRLGCRGTSKKNNSVVESPSSSTSTPNDSILPAVVDSTFGTNTATSSSLSENAPVRNTAVAQSERLQQELALKEKELEASAGTIELLRQELKVTLQNQSDAVKDSSHVVSKLRAELEQSRAEHLQATGSLTLAQSNISQLQFNVVQLLEATNRMSKRQNESPTEWNADLTSIRSELRDDLDEEKRRKFSATLEHYHKSYKENIYMTAKLLKQCADLKSRNSYLELTVKKQSLQETVLDTNAQLTSVEAHSPSSK